MKALFLISILFLVGCNKNLFDSELKCKDGVIYVKQGGAWVQAMIYKDNKCLPIEGAE